MLIELSPEETKRVEEIALEWSGRINQGQSEAFHALKQAILTALQPHLEENARLREALKKIGGLTEHGEIEPCPICKIVEDALKQI